jgi:hypothetical protein
MQHHYLQHRLEAYRRFCGIGWVAFITGLSIVYGLSKIGGFQTLCWMAETDLKYSQRQSISFLEIRVNCDNRTE